MNTTVFGTHLREDISPVADAVRHSELLGLRNISVEFGGIKAVSDISFSVFPGELLSVIGPNGAGKSSLLNVISGVYQPSAGHLEWHGTLIKNWSPERAAHLGIGRTFQNLALFKGMTVLENVMSGRHLKIKYSAWAHAIRWPHAFREEAKQRGETELILEFFGLQSHRHVVVNKLPYGLQKRVELARALAAEPKLLLLDEPLAGMNANEKHELARLIVEVNRRLKTTMILIEHDMGVVMDISDRVVVLDYGRKIADGLPVVVRDLPEVIAAYVGKRD